MGNKRNLSLLGLVPAAATLLIMAAWLAPASPAQGAPNAQEPDPSLPCAPFTEFDPANFSNPTNIDNDWLPLEPGQKLVLKGTAEGEHRRVVFIVTDLTKVINGVRTRVIWDRDYRSGHLAESELAFFAQDDDGNVWNLGEYPEEYEDGVFIGAPSTWIQGIGDAQGGVHMPRDPEVGTPEYLQGSVPDIEFLDCARVIGDDDDEQVGEVCVPVDCYDDIVLTEERSPLDIEGGFQHKYHAEDVGIVKVTAVDDPQAENLDLIKDVELKPNQKRWARQQALKLEARAYEVSEIYQQTEPAQRLFGGSIGGPTATPDASLDPTPTPTPEAAPDPSPTPTAGAVEQAAPEPPTLGVVPTPTGTPTALAVAPLRTVPAVALGAFQAPTRAPRARAGLGFLPSILPAGGGLPGDELGSTAALITTGVALVLMASYGRVYLIRRVRYGSRSSRYAGRGARGSGGRTTWR